MEKLHQSTTNAQQRSYFLKGLFVGIASFCIIVAAALTFGLTRPMSARPLDNSAKIQEIYKILEDHYVYDLDLETITEAMFIGMLYGVGDPYTSYMGKEALRTFLERNDGRYAGIGVRVHVDPQVNQIEILQVFRGGPSESAGLIPGDVIVEVNGLQMSGSNYEEAVAMMRGTPGTKVNITILRPSENNRTFQIEITRANVEVPTIEHKMLDDEVGYIQIVSFDRVTYQQFMDALENLKANNMRALVIDVRNNPGGLLDSVVQITNELVPEGLIVYTEDKNGRREEMRADNDRLNIPLAVLVNENSASASEVLAGAVRDTGVGILVGNRTFGKGVVQSLFPLSDGSGIKVTVAKYYSPKGISIHGEGIPPDILIETDRETSLRLSTLETWQDQQLMHALDSLRASIGR